MRRCVLLPCLAAVALALGGCSGGPAGAPTSASLSSVAPASSTRAQPSTPAPSTSARRTTVTRSPSRTATPTDTRSSSSSAPSSAPSSTPAPPVTGRPTVVLNPGHNGGNAANAAYINRQVPAGHGEYKACDTTGTNTDAGYSEHAFNWDVTLRVRRLLEARGVRVVLTRPNDIGVGPCVNERAAVGNRAGVVANVTIHADGAPASGHGYHVNQAARRPDGASAATADASVQLGRAIRNTLAASSGLTPSTYIGTDGMYFRNDFAALNLARTPSTFLELGNMRNASDAAEQSSAAGRQRIAAAIATGILAFLSRR